MVGQKVITIAQQKGGAGKTTIAAHLGVALVQRGLRVAMIDIDPQGSLTHWHRIREERFGEGYTGIHFSSLSGWRVGTEVSRLRPHFDIILIDSPPHVETEARTAIRNADLIIIPVQPSPTDLWATKATVDIAKAEKVPLLTVLNRVNSKSRLYDIIRRELHDVSHSILSNRIIFAAAMMDGFGVTELEPNGQASLEIKDLAREALKMLPKEANKNFSNVRTAENSKSLAMA